MAYESHKSKRGRKPNNASDASNQQPSAPAQQQQQQQQQQAEGGGGEEMDEVDAQETQRPRKRGRPRTSLESHPEEETTTTGPQASRPKAAGKRKRQSAGDELTERAEGAKRGRKKKEQGADAEAPVEEHERQENQGNSQQPKKRKRGRPSLQDIAPSEAQNKAPAEKGQRKRGRPRSSGASVGEAEAETEPTSPPKRKRGRPSIGSAEQQQDQDAQPTEEQPRPRSKQNDDKPDAPLPPKRYMHVAPHVRGVKQSLIDAKWTPLGPPSVAIATEILELAHRPILQRMAGTARRRQHTSAALSVAYRRITRKLQRGLPFPPAGMPATGRGGGDGGRETELDFESVLEGKRSLEKQLDPALHAVELLRKEKDRMVRELERDYMTLRNLEAGARTQAREQRDQLKKAHVLAPEASSKPHLEDVEMLTNEGLLIPPGNSFKDIEDGEIKDLALQLSGHMDSIKTNLQQVDGLLPQMAYTKATLRRVLNQHLDQKSYQKAVLGL